MCDLFILDKHILKSNFKIDNISTQCPSISRDIISERIALIKKYQKQLKKLMKIPVIEQKTDIWYKTRENMISASDFAQALGFGKFGTAKQLIQKKCEPVNESAFSQTNPFFKWGNMFEPVAIQIYSKLAGVNVNSFGLIKHPKYDFFGASPDGIDELGRMVEIKCPMKRTIIKGSIPTQYEYQMQGQLDVCELDECYYFECEFGTTESLSEFEEIAKKYEFKGGIIETKQCEFEYSDNITEYKNICDWVAIESKKHYEKIIYWYLKNFNLQRVIRNKDFMNEKMKDLKEVWDKILYYRTNKEKYVIEVLNTIDIETESLYLQKNKDPQQKKKIKGYSFLDLE
jgi:putative phage-type endonuclease